MVNQIFSQFGQSEWLLDVCNHLGINYGIIFEAGANSPHYISNARSFLNAGWSALLIEPGKKNCDEWNALDNLNVKIFNTYISYEKMGLENILKQIHAPLSIDVFFFDIDGGEYQLLNGMNSFRPKFICVEYDNAYPLAIDFVPKQIRHGIQASSTAMFRLMEEKGYIYIKSFFHDHIFVSQEFFKSLNISIFHDIGKEAFCKQAPKHLYNFGAVLLYQNENEGNKGIDFYKTKLKHLVANGYVKDAYYFYCMLSQIFYSFKEIVKSVRSANYYQQYVSAYNQFENTYQQDLFYTSNVFDIRRNV